MKPRTLLAPLALAILAAACGAESPTATRAPERASYDGGSLGPGHASTTSGTPSDSTGRGGSYGPGH